MLGTYEQFSVGSTNNGVSEKMATLKSGSAFSKTVKNSPKTLENVRKRPKRTKRPKRPFFSIFFQLPPSDPEAPQPPLRLPPPRTCLPDFPYWVQDKKEMAK